MVFLIQALGGRVSAEPRPLADLGIGIGGVRTGGTAAIVSGGVGFNVTPEIVVGVRGVAGRSGAIDLVTRPEHVTVGFVGPSVAHIGEVAFVSGAIGLSIFDAGRTVYRAGVELRAGALMRFGPHAIAFAVESVTPLQGSPVPAIAFLVGYHH